ncbi:MAG TPA: methyltransferase domain-containing protein [Steroidobacteraceae bacterium]
MKLPTLLTLIAAIATVPLATAAAASPDKALQAAVDGNWRTPKDTARDVYRHPVEALTFWGLKPGMTILEVQPGGGWWTEILAPYAKLSGGKYYATAADLANPELSDRSKKARADFAARFAAKPDLYGQLQFVNWGPKSAPLPANTFDFILTARSIHNWMQTPGWVEKNFSDFFAALKPGGILAVEEHRANAGGAAEKPETGYVSEAYVIAQAEKAGFKLAGRSEINANPKDTKDHPFGVWTLPPTLTSVPENSDKPEDPNFDHSKYVAIGESDRMTLRFVKP